MVDYRAGIANTQEVSEYLVVSEDMKSVTHTHTHSLSFSLCLSLSLTHTHTHTHPLFLSLEYVRETQEAARVKIKNKQCLITTQHVIQMAVSPSEDKGMTE